MKNWLTLDLSDFSDWKVTGLTEDGWLALIEITDRIEDGQDIELICVDMDLEVEAFRIFFAACNLLGAIDAVEKAKEITNG